MGKRGRTRRRAEVRAERKNRTAASQRERATAGRSLGSRVFLWTWPAVVALVAIWAHVRLDNPPAAGIAALVGTVLWLAVGLSTLGARVRPRDRTGASAIDFGRRT